jgi:hypothetical protein
MEVLINARQVPLLGLPVGVGYVVHTIHAKPGLILVVDGRSHLVVDGTWQTQLVNELRELVKERPHQRR